MTKYEAIPITPAIITWARERAGYTLDAAEEQFKKIAKWEAGEVYPTYPQLENLADAFKVPIAVFFFPKPPDLPPYPRASAHSAQSCSMKSRRASACWFARQEHISSASKSFMMAETHLRA